MRSWHGNLSPFGSFHRAGASGLALYAVLGYRPPLVADMVNDAFYSATVRSTFGAMFTHSRLGNATMVDSDGLLKWGPHNLALNSATPATQSITVVSGADYTVECTGSGSITLSGAGSGTVTEGNPVEVTASTTSLTLTVVGSLDLMWCYRSDLGGMAPVPPDARVAGSTAYVPTTSTAKYLPRRHNHVYNGSAWVDAGTLIETEARTNLITYSVPVNAQWTTAQATITENAATAPDGTATASEITEDSTASAFHYARPAFISMGAAPHTVSCYLKAGTATTASLFLAQSGNVGAVFDLSAGTVSSVSGTGNTASIEDAGNGWYRCIITNDGGADINNQVRVGVDDGALAASNGDGVSSVYAWGLQVEAASTPSSYIPTSGSTVARAAETLTIPAANLPWPSPRVIGEELVTNGTFDSDLSGWTIGSDPAQVIATFDAGRVSLTRGAGGSSGFSQNIGMTAGKVYRVRFDVISGVAAVGTGFPATGGLSGSVELVKVATGSSISLWPSSTSSTTVIDNISVKEIDPLVVAIQMKGRATGDNYTSLRWYADANNYITQEIGTSDFTLEQAASGTVDSVTGGSFTSGVNVPFNVASYHGSTLINGAVDGTALTADTTPTALPDLSSTDLSVAYDFMGNIEEVRIWVGGITDVTSGNLLISEASS